MTICFGLLLQRLTWNIAPSRHHLHLSICMMDSSNLLLAETQEGEGLDRPGAQMQTCTHIETEIWGYQRLAGTKKLGGQQVCVCVWGGGALLMCFFWQEVMGPWLVHMGKNKEMTTGRPKSCLTKKEERKLYHKLHPKQHEFNKQLTGWRRQGAVEEKNAVGKSLYIQWLKEVSVTQSKCKSVTCCGTIQREKVMEKIKEKKALTANI